MSRRRRRFCALGHSLQTCSNGPFLGAQRALARCAVITRLQLLFGALEEHSGLFVERLGTLRRSNRLRGLQGLAGVAHLLDGGRGAGAEDQCGSQQYLSDVPANEHSTRMGRFSIVHGAAGVLLQASTAPYDRQPVYTRPTRIMSHPDPDEVLIYHNPRCSKSRETLELLRSRGVEPRVIEYLKTPPSKEELERILELLALEPREFMRRQEPEFEEAGLDDPGLTRDTLIYAMIQRPKLIQRPIVLANGKAAIGRPPERVLEIL